MFPYALDPRHRGLIARNATSNASDISPTLAPSRAASTAASNKLALPLAAAVKALSASATAAPSRDFLAVQGGQFVQRAHHRY